MVWVREASADLSIFGKLSFEQLRRLIAHVSPALRWGTSSSSTLPLQGSAARPWRWPPPIVRVAVVLFSRTTPPSASTCHYMGVRTELQVHWFSGLWLRLAQRPSRKGSTGHYWVPSHRTPRTQPVEPRLSSPFRWVIARKVALTNRAKGSILEAEARERRFAKFRNDKDNSCERLTPGS
jgi:hypothetical protein